MCSLMPQQQVIDTGHAGLTVKERLNLYCHGKCRCADCRAEMAAYQRGRRFRLGITKAPGHARVTNGSNVSHSVVPFVGDGQPSPTSRSGAHNVDD